MRGKKLRVLAIILSICLVLNNGVWDLAGYAYAAKGTYAFNTVSETSEKSTELSSVPTSTESVTVVEEEPSQVQAPTEENSDAPEQSSGENEDVTGESKEEESEQNESTESGEDTTATEEVITTEEDNETETTETESETSKETEEETEEETTQEPELGVQIKADATDANRLPDDLGTYLSQLQNGTAKDTYYIQSWADFIKVQEFCKDAGVNGFAGVTFIISDPEDSTAEAQVWNTSEIAATLGGTSYTFSGIGTEENPFKGTMYCYFKVGYGIKFKLGCPLFAYLGDGANIYQLDIIANGCSAAVAENIVGNVTVSDLNITGSIGNADTDRAGTVAATLMENAAVTLSKITSTASVTAKRAGGIAGQVEADVTMNVPGGDVAIGTNEAPIRVTGSEECGGLYGNIAENHTVDLMWLSRVVSQAVGNGGCVGQVAGRVYDSTLTLTNATEVTVNVSGTGNAGGLVGLCQQNAVLAMPSGKVTVSGSVLSLNGNTGGLIGWIRDSSMEIGECEIAANVTGTTTGGVVGVISAGKIVMHGATVTGALTGSWAVGGVSGGVDYSSAVELHGTYTIADQMSGTDRIGNIAGTRDAGSLIYLYGAQGKIDGVSQLSVPMHGEHPKYNDIYEYGGVFRNQDMGNNMLLGDGTLGNVGTVFNYISLSDGFYQIGEGGEVDAAADLETFAIVHYTNMEYGLNCFENATSYASLLSASYYLHNDADISYDTTGIISLNRNDTENEEYAFSGRFYGKEGGVTITQSAHIYQWRTGVFSCLKGDTEFKNLIIEGEVTRATNVGGLAYRTTGPSLTLENITVRKTIYDINTAVAGVLVREDYGGVFKLTANNIALESNINAGTANDCSGFINFILIADISVKNVTVGGSHYKTGGGISGGFMGREWNQVGGLIENVSIPESYTYDTNAVFGAMFHYLSSRAEGIRVRMKNIDLANMNLTMYGQGDSSLLIHNGQALVLELIDYSAAGATVNGTVAADFDEVVAVNILEPAQRTFAIVSLHQTGKYFPEYHYEYQATYTGSVPAGNNWSRYYYDLFQHIDTENADGTTTPKVTINWEAAGTQRYYIIDTPAKYMVWSILQSCSNGAQLRNALAPYFQDRAMPATSEQFYYFEGDLNLENYSVYPIPWQRNCTYIGRNNAKITFTAAGMENWGLSNVKDTQHYLMHSGMFYSTNGHITVDNITLAGTIGAPNQNNCGALVVGTLNGGGDFTNITLDNLRVNGYSGDASSLLITTIPSGTANFDGIKLTGYNPEDYTTTKAAASLIYYAGGQDVTNLVLNFHAMDMIQDGDNLTSLVAGEIFEYSSFIYHYDYTDDASINEGSGLYLFSKNDDETGNVTYGEELDYDTEYSDTEDKVFTEGVDPNPKVTYIPYVHSGKQIEVNPKSGHILKGCGTYEDPYVIETHKQFLTLYRYMNEPELEDEEDNYQYEALYRGWKVIKRGDDSLFCSTKHNVEVLGTDANGNTLYSGEGTADARMFGEEGFPTPQELSEAYYQLGADIDLSGISNITYKTIAQDFVGFGTPERPFVGVWYGKDTEGNIHSITLPDKEPSANYTTYGLIQFAQGAVVKDLNITVDNPNAVTPAQVTSFGGSVIATILGGDNIIDNVTTSVTVRAATATIIGGYVGNIRKGGLILRNVTADSVKDFRVRLDGTTVNYCGTLVGRVEDGFVVYEGNDISSDIFELSLSVVEKSNGQLAETVAIPAYDILNGTKLKSDAAGIGISVTDTAGGTNEKDVVVTIPNAAALQVMSMAMNADALNIAPASYQDYSPETDTHWGYSEKSRSRKADYSQIGACTAATADYQSAAAYDNVMGYASSEKAYAYPYIYQYMGITGTGYPGYIVTDANNGIFSIMNPGEALNGTIYHVYWNLAQSGTYGMGVYADGFRGIGGIYRNGAGYGATFRGNFNGNGSNVILDMKRNVVKGPDDAFKDSLRRAGLFNTFNTVTYGDVAKGIYNDTADYGGLDGNVVSYPCYTIENVNIGGSIQGTNSSTGYHTWAGGIVAVAGRGNYCFKNIGTVETAPLQIGSASGNKRFIEDAGGIVGNVAAYTNVLVQDCQWNAEQPITYITYGHAGGLVGIVNSTEIFKIMDCTMENLSADSLSQNAGGLVAYAMDTANESGKIILKGSVKDAICVKNSSMTARYQAGGIMGESRWNLEAINLCSEGNTLSAMKDIGGIIGDLAAIKYPTARTSYIESVTVKDIVTIQTESYEDTTSIGGVVGSTIHALTIKDVMVSGEKKGDEYTCRLTSDVATNKVTFKGGVKIGGVVGYHNGGDKTVLLEDCKVSGVKISARSKYTDYSKTIAGGIIGTNNPKCIVKLGGEVSTDHLVIEVPTKTQADSENLVAGFAGGCFGYVREQIIGADGTFYEGLTTDSNTISGMRVGGLVGSTEGNSGSVLTKFQAVNVSNGTLTGDGPVGGLVGYYEMNHHATEYNAETALDASQSNIVSNMHIMGKSAGGAFGYVIYKKNGLKINNLIVQDSTIIGTASSEEEMCSAGGVIGETVCTSSAAILLNQISLSGNTIACEIAGNSVSEERLVNQATGGVLGRILNTSTEGEIRADDITVDNTNRIGIRNKDAILDNGIKLLKKEGENYVLSGLDNSDLPDASTLVTEGETDPDTGEAVTAKNYDALERLVQTYGYCVGNFIGASQSAGTRFYLMRSEDSGNPFVIPVMDINPPVTDVGSISAEQMDRESDTHYRKYVHIIYGAPVTEIVENGVSYMASDAVKNVAFMKKRAESVGKTEYTSSSVTLNELLSDYRLSEEEAKLFMNSYEESYSYPGTDYSVGPILVHKPENGTLQDVMESFTDIMTNIAGASAADIPENRLTITTKQKVVAQDGTVTDGDGTPSIRATITDGVVTFEAPQYDGVTADGKMTYTELTFTYNYGTTKHMKVFRLPVYVEEPILYGVHMKIIEDSVTSIDKIKSQGILAPDSIQMANDSDYTLLLEYAYGDVREKMPDEVITDKSFYLLANGQPKAFAPGTKLRLIDVANGNKPYYYEISGEGITQVVFSQFKDNDGNYFENRPINTLETITDAEQEYYSDMAAKHQAQDEDKVKHQLEDVGLERYLLTVLSEDTSSQIYEIHAGMIPQLKGGTQKDHDGVASLFAPFEGHEEMPWLSVTAVPGLTIKLKDGTDPNGDYYTDITGEISKDGTLTVKATFSIFAEDQIYWQLLANNNGLDSENNGKYLEIGFYLRDDGNRISLPAGTNYSYMLPDGSYSENKVIQDNSLVYYYKDIRTLFEEDGAEYKIDSLTGNVDVTVEFKLTFAGADLSEFTEESYMAWIELLRTANRDYPMGIGNTLDYYSKEVAAYFVNNLGFAIRATDMNQLAINTYPVAAESNVIEYQTMFDFSEILERISGIGEEAAREKWAGYDYEVTYELWLKTENGANVVYERYEDNDIVITVPAKAGGTISSVNGAVTTVYNFTASEIRDGNTGVAGLLQEDGSITISTSALTGGDQSKLTNYKIIATMKVMESGVESDGTEPTSDFFVYTITRLKTDLSE